jgi:hypothetical protein
VSCRQRRCPWAAGQPRPDGHHRANDRVLTFGDATGCSAALARVPGGIDLWASYRQNTHDDFGWQTPVNLGPVVNSPADDDGATLLPNDDGTVTLYFTSNRPGGLGDFDIYSSTWSPSGGFTVPVLVTELSSPGRDTRTALSRDGLEIYITSNRAGSMVGADDLPSLDLWVATRASTSDPWSAPVNLGPTINTGSNEGAPALSWDGMTLYFYSNRPEGLGGNDLFVTSRKKCRHDD